MSPKILDYEPWVRSWPLNPFREKLGTLKSENLESKKLVLTKPRFRVSLNTISTLYHWIGCILSRLDDEIAVFKGSIDDLGFVAEYKVISLMNIDVISFFVFCSILMDSVAYFFDSLLTPKNRPGPQTKSFDAFKKSLPKFEGLEFDDLKRIIENTQWFDDLKDLRDKFIIHRALHYSQILKVEDRIEKPLMRFNQEGVRKEKWYSYQDINRLCHNILRFLQDLNKFLCDNFDSLPLEVKRSTVRIGKP